MFFLYIVVAVVDVVAVVVVVVVDVAAAVVVVVVDATYQRSPALWSKPNKCFETKKEKIVHFCWIEMSVFGRA